MGNLKILRVNPIIQYKGGLPPTFLDNIRYVINAVFKAKNILKTEKIDIIHSNNFSPALAGSIVSSLTKKPHITTIHDIFSIYDKDFWKKWASQSNVSYANARLVPLFEKMMIRFKISCIHTVSESTKRDIQRLGAKKSICVIPNCIQEEQPLQVVSKPKQFAYLGRLVFYKNIEVILKAFVHVTKEFPDSRLVIAGDGPYRESLQNVTQKLGLENNVEFRGYVTLDQKKICLLNQTHYYFQV